MKSLIIVFGGTISAPFIAFPFTKTIRSFKSIPKVFAAEQAEEATTEIYEKSKIIAEKRYSGNRITNDDISGLANPFMRRWIEALIVREQVEQESLEQILQAEVQMNDVLPEIAGLQKSVSDNEKYLESVMSEIRSIREALVKHGIMTP